MLVLKINGCIMTEDGEPVLFNSERAAYDYYRSVYRMFFSPTTCCVERYID